MTRASILTFVLTDGQRRAYLARIGVAVSQLSPLPSLSLLRELQVRHLKSVPFENLSIHLGEPIVLETDALFEKIVTRRRGGFCYELNGLFAALLQTFGFDVELLAGTVGGSRPFDHLALGVQLPGEPQTWLSDVGFGRLSAYPIPWQLDTDLEDPLGPLRLSATPAGDVEVWRAGKVQYVVETRPRALVEFEPMCWYQQHHPQSAFRTGLVCARLTETFGYATVAGRQLILTEGGERTERPLGSDAEVLAAYQKWCGVTLDRAPELEAKQ